MQLVCPCLNVTLNVVVEDERNFDELLVKSDEQIEQICGCEDDSAAIEDEFFAVLCSGGSVARFVLDSEKGIQEKLPVLLKRRRVDRWEIRRCILCNTDAYAIASANYAGQVLVNIKLFLHDESVISERRKSAEISPTFQVVLPKMNEAMIDDGTLTENNANHTAGNQKSGFSNGGVGGAKSSSTMVPRGALHAVQSVVGQHLRREQERMEERIRAFTDEQQAAFDRSKSLAKSEKLKVLSILAKNGGATGGGSGSTSGMISSTDWSSFGSVSGGGGGGAVFGDEEFDSAVPLSPMSLTSGGGPSPGFVDPKTMTSGSFRAPNENMAPLRPKAHSNPASLTGWKRKRHSGGPGLAPLLASHPEEQQDIFSFEEQDTDDLHHLNSYLPADDEGDTTDDSGTGEDYKKYYPPPPPPAVSSQQQQQQQSARSIITANNPTTIPSQQQHRTINYCTSLPVRVPEPSKGARWTPPDENSKFHYDQDDERNEDDDDVEDELFTTDMEKSSSRMIDQPPPKDVGASMQALARSIQSANDPERLFGERPQRRRYKTGDNSTTGADFPPNEFSSSIVPQRIVANQTNTGAVVDGRRKPSVVVLFKEEQNF